MNPIRQLARGPLAAIEMTNIILTQGRGGRRHLAPWRCLESSKDHPVPLLLVFALIPPGDLRLRPGSSLIEFMLDEGFDVSLLEERSSR